jgi:GMP synthase (glutamine-hydrolysing)
VILFVDLEHESTYTKPKTDWLLAARARISYRLQDITGRPCLLQRYRHVTPALLADHGIAAVFISGQGADRDLYDPDETAGLRAVVRDATVPVFGFCGGLQFMAEAWDVPVERVGPIPEGEEDPYPEYQPGWVKEVGYLPVEVSADHPVVAGLGPDPVFRHAHTWELKAVPDGFTVLATTDVTPVQLVVHDGHRQGGAQFHPEYWTDDHPDGRRLIENFCRWADLIA